MRRKHLCRVCPFPNCGERISDKRLFCKPHWFLLPRETQALLIETWKRDGFHVVVAKLIQPAIKQIERSLSNGAKRGSAGEGVSRAGQNFNHQGSN